ncbi:MAG: DUF3142 domain-containing protein [Halopseudomonas aestusnigri]
MWRGYRTALLWGVILICTSSFNNLRAQEVAVDHWLWAGQNHTDILASEKRVQNQCQKLEAQCRISNLRVLVRSWAGENPSFSTKHHTPRLLVKGSSVILSYRLEHLLNFKKIAAVIQRDINIWGRANRPVIGVEIDFDSPSSGLKEYHQWLGKLQIHLTEKIPLSITGLPTWFEDNNKLATDLARSVSEVSLMFYRQEQTPITKHLLVAINKVNNLRYAFLCDDNRWEALVRETKKNETFRMAIFLISRCVDVGKPSPS